MLRTTIAGLEGKVKELEGVIESQPIQQVSNGRIFSPDLNFTLEEKITGLSGELAMMEKFLEGKVRELMES